MNSEIKQSGIELELDGIEGNKICCAVLRCAHVLFVDARPFPFFFSIHF